MFPKTTTFRLKSQRIEAFFLKNCQIISVFPPDLTHFVTTSHVIPQCSSNEICY